MAKELPYFKFIATEWLTGSIALESFDLQGLFTTVCALYWKNSGVLSVKELEQRYKKKKLLTELFEKYTPVSNGMITIPFLDEQFTERQHTCKKNADNVSKRWDKNRPDVTIPNHTSVSDGNTKSYNKEEEREEEKKEKKKKEKEIELPDGSYQKFLSIYSDWYEKKVGLKIKFDSVQGQALKKIIVYLVANSKEKSSQGGADAWEYILQNWSSIDKFYQDQIKINQIESNLPNILNQLKNGNSKSKQINNQSDLHSSIDAMFGSQG